MRSMVSGVAMHPIVSTLGVAFVAVLAGSALALAADPPPVPVPHPPAAITNTSLRWCGDVEPLRADPSMYSDEPIYVGNEMPTDAVRRWAKDKPGYVDLWIDREHHGWINVLFTQDVRQRQAEIEREFPGVGVVAVKAENRLGNLRVLEKRVLAFAQAQALTDYWVTGPGIDDVIHLGVHPMTDELAAAIESEFAGDPLCVEGSDPADLIEPGPQPLAGEGWTMLGWEHGNGPAHELGIATDQAGYERLWERSGLGGPPPDVDFGTNVVVWFAVAHGSSCPNVRLEEIVVDHERAQVYPLTVDPDNNMACTDDLTGAYQFVATLERSELPAGPFEIGLGGGGGSLFRAQYVDADLSGPGTVLADDAVEERPQHPRSGTIQETIGSFLYEFDTSCGIGYLGVINDTHWVTDEPMPEAWSERVRDDGDLLVKARLRTEPEPHVKAQAGGVVVRYRPAGDAPADCEP